MTIITTWSWLASALALVAGLFGRATETADAVVDAPPADRLVGVTRAIAATLARKLQFETDRAAAQQQILNLKATRSTLVVAAHTGDAQARKQANGINADIRRHETAVDELDEAIDQVGAELLRLDGERAEAERAQLESCVALLCKEQADLATTIDSDLAAAVEKIRRWCELDMLVVDHARRLDVGTGRDLYSRLSDALSHHVYRSLPDIGQANAMHVVLNPTSARRATDFEALSQIHGPAGSVSRQPAATTEA